MVQVKKPELRKRILDVSGQLFVENGVDGTSMRTIAAASKMTVGNLYRYFDSKEDIIKEITSGTLEKLNRLILEVTKGRIAIDKVSDKPIDISLFEFRSMTDDLAAGIIKIFKEDKNGLLIIGNEYRLYDEVVEWFKRTIDLLAENWYSGKMGPEDTLITKMMTYSVLAGLKELFREANLTDMSDDDLTKSLKRYLSIVIVQKDE